MDGGDRDCEQERMPAIRISLCSFQDISDIHSYNTRSSVSHNFYAQSSRLSIQVNSFSRIGTKNLE